MGTNYYIRENVCEHCGRAADEVHLGKSSFGWRFTLQANGLRFYKNWDEMKKWLHGKRIYDEYDEPIFVQDFIELVESKQDTIDPQSDTGYEFMQEINGYKFYDCEFS